MHLDDEGWASFNSLAAESGKSAEQVRGYVRGADCFEVVGDYVRHPGGATGSRGAVPPFSVFGPGAPLVPSTAPMLALTHI